MQHLTLKSVLLFTTHTIKFYCAGRKALLAGRAAIKYVVKMYHKNNINTKNTITLKLDNTHDK